ESRLAWLPVSEAPGQAERVFDLLARLSSHPSAPFEHLLGAIRRDVRPGATILVVSSRDPSPYLRHLRRLAQAGWPVVFIGAGRDAAADVGRARLAGLAARTARLDGPWRTATGLAVSG
ncbi:MAG TPA: hypothetical protein VHS36_01145, partial [Candidatus Limnocylindrales bacterium]|nr:hypothetical protein [Candidatus Limnocylindrales bacterium]